MSEREKAQPTSVNRKRLRAGAALEQVSKNVFIMNVDLSEPTGEDYFKTLSEYDELETQSEELATGAK